MSPGLPIGLRIYSKSRSLGMREERKEVKWETMESGTGQQATGGSGSLVCFFSPRPSLLIAFFLSAMERVMEKKPVADDDNDDSSSGYFGEERGRINLSVCSHSPQEKKSREGSEA